MSIFGSKDPFNRSYAGSLPILGAVPDSFVWPIIGVTIAIVFVVLVIYAVLQYRKTSVKKLLVGPVNLFTPASPVVIDRDSVAKLMRGTYTLAFYLQIDAVPDMRASATKLFTWPGIWNMDYKPSSEEMIWTFTQTRNTPSEDPIPEEVVMPRVPLQRWVQVVIGFEGRSVDLYANGELVKSELLNNLPTSGSSSITIVPNNVMGKLAYVQLWPRRLPVHEVAENYKETSDSQGRPFVDPGIFDMFTQLKMPNIFCPNGDCTGANPTTSQSQTWEFPYA
jgi:hypothetical protein